MSCKTIDVPSKTYGSMFGNISKCVWFKVNDGLDYMSVDYSIKTEQLYDVVLILTSYGDQIVQWKKTFLRTSNNQVITGTKYIYNRAESLNTYKLVNV